MGKKTKEKKAFIFDTNFIIENKDLEKIFDTLEDEFNIYITQISIDERIAQQVREAEEVYNKIDSFRNKIFTKITVEHDYNAYKKILEQGVQNKYKNLFGERIISYRKTGKVLELILDKANYKVPPFIKDSNSDKGFKDALMWDSIIQYFKDNGENEVIFLSRDGGFTKNAEDLQNEFDNATGKKILIKDNSYYNELLKSLEDKKEEDKDLNEDDKNLSEKGFDINQLRADVDYTISSVCFIDNYYANIYGRTFILNEKVDCADIINMYNMLEYNLKRHYLEIELYADKVLGITNKLESTDIKIPITNLDNLVELHKKIKDKYPELKNQFYEATVSIFNNNYQKPIEDEDDMPF